jgi:PIN domain nuclease of toxin-antitoxin system
MTTHVLDASALLRYLDREPGFDRIAALLKQAAKGNTELLVSAVNWGEVASVLYKIHGPSGTRITLSKLRTLPLTLEPADAGHAEAAGFSNTTLIFHTPTLLPARLLFESRHAGHGQF